MICDFFLVTSLAFSRIRKIGNIFPFFAAIFNVFMLNTEHTYLTQLLYLVYKKAESCVGLTRMYVQFLSHSISIEYTSIFLVFVKALFNLPFFSVIKYSCIRDFNFFSSVQPKLLEF